MPTITYQNSDQNQLPIIESRIKGRIGRLFGPSAVDKFSYRPVSGAPDCSDLRVRIDLRDIKSDPLLAERLRESLSKRLKGCFGSTCVRLV